MRLALPGLLILLRCFASRRNDAFKLVATWMVFESSKNFYFPNQAARPLLVRKNSFEALASVVVTTGNMDYVHNFSVDALTKLSDQGKLGWQIEILIQTAKTHSELQRSVHLFFTVLV